jgi:hypothetical protein
MKLRSARVVPDFQLSESVHASAAGGVVHRDLLGAASWETRVRVTPRRSAAWAPLSHGLSMNSWTSALE